MAEDPEPSESSKSALAKALYSYIGESANELDFRQNDLLDIYSNLDQKWWYAKRRRGGKFGYVPCNYVLLVDSDVTDLSAWQLVTRREAEKLLLSPSNAPGTFIVRPSSTGYYALSVKAKHNKKKFFYFILHYKITLTSNGGCYISPSITFTTVPDLIAHYHEHRDGLYCKLTDPCPAEPQPLTDIASVEINRECIILAEKIGNGSFSEVFLGFWNNSVPVAVKTLKPDAKDTKAFVNETQLLLRLSHPNVLKIMGVCTEKEPAYIITELMINGCLLDYLRKDNGHTLTLEHLVQMIIQVSSGMAYLESLNIVHRDLRAANVLVGEGNLVKVADFGLARQLDESGIYVCNVNATFPAKWTPVEAATKGHFSIKSDVWSFGILIWEIVTYGSSPYAGLSNREVLEFVARGYRMPNPSGGHIRCDQNIYHIMLKCWRTSPDNRPTFSRLKEVLMAYMLVYTAATQ